MSTGKFLRAESDCIVGKRSRLERFLICSTQGYFPVLARTGRQSLAVIFRTGGTHVSASATLAVSTSKDGGKCWSDPVEITPRWEDSRNPAFGVNAKGDLIAAYWKACMDCYVNEPNGLQWKGLKAKGKVPTMFVRRSADNGRTWSKEWAYKSELLTLPSPYGRIIAAPDGTLLMSVYGTPRKKRKGVRDICILLRSRDGGKTWGDESLVAVAHNETSYTFLPGGRLLAAARSESGGVATMFSDDVGRTWSKPVPVTRKGEPNGEHPADLTVLASGAVQLTFGRRIRPMGCGVLFSADGGATWDTAHEVLLAGDGIRNLDLGYPSTVQLADGAIVTALYYASGSETSADFPVGWGDISCQAIRYREECIR